MNRYGPGMVIYWFGHMANLSSERDILITDRLPLEILLPGDLDPHMGIASLSSGAHIPMVHGNVETISKDALSRCAYP